MNEAEIISRRSVLALLQRIGELSEELQAALASHLTGSSLPYRLSTICRFTYLTLTKSWRWAQSCLSPDWQGCFFLETCLTSAGPNEIGRPWRAQPRIAHRIFLGGNMEE
jgi:hypothetical protein